MNKISDYINRRYFSKDLPFNYRIYMIFFIECLVISILSATANTLLGKGWAGVVFQWTFIVVCIVVLFIPTKWRMAIIKPLLIFVAFVYIPFLFFQTAGYNGTAGLFSLLAIFLIAVIFSGKMRIALIISNIALWIIACTVQYMYPQIVITHGNEQANYIDYITALTVGASGIAILGIYIKNTYEDEQARISSLLKNEEHANRKLEELTNRDPLTGTYNRRFLTGFLDAELKSEENLSIMMLDIDYFKEINDTWGHGFGDETLVVFSSTIQDSLRKDDILARTGGEEFIVVLKRMELQNAKEVAERIRKSVAKITFQNDARITVSIGLVQAKPDESVDSLINRADKCLYEAKSLGRNRVVSEES